MLYLFIYKGTGHPMLLIGGGFNQLGWITMGIFLCFKSTYYIHYATIPYVFVHATTSLCVYKEWLPTKWNQYPKENFEMQTLWAFICACAVPACDYRITCFALFPMYMVS
jgi:hypothetical protein